MNVLSRIRVGIFGLAGYVLQFPQTLLLRGAWRLIIDGPRDYRSWRETGDGDYR